MTYSNKNKAIAIANKSTGVHYVVKNISGFEVVAEDYIHTAVGKIIHESK